MPTILRVGEPGVYVPGQLPEQEPLPGSDGETQKVSPKKQRTGGQSGGAVIDVETFKSLLAEQAAQINETQRLAMADMMANFRKDLDEHKSVVQQELRQTCQRAENTEKKIGDLAARVGMLESAQGKAQMGATGQDDRHKFTLVFGGWPRDSARKDILKDLQTTLTRLDLKGLTDADPFTTGPRRSLALQSFVVRPNETFVGMRNRMSVIVAAISNTAVILGDGEAKLWASFSRSREARQNGDHAAWMRRVIRKVSPGQEEWLEVEYGAGAAWLRGQKFCSAVDPAPDGVPREFLLTDPAKGDKP